MLASAKEFNEMFQLGTLFYELGQTKRFTLYLEI